ncbi:MAG: hypothetical protein AAGK04_05510, partial [Planctomycetota bacterium]
QTRPSGPPAPAPPTSPDELPAPLTFFLTVEQRRTVLDALSAWHADRTRALLAALGVKGARDGGQAAGGSGPERGSG